jgi:hypothetical protein
MPLDKRSSMICATVAAAVLVSVAAAAQPNAGAPSTLTPTDYVQIQQLVARYAFALDTGDDNGYAYANLFAPDGESVNPDAKGREQLAALARGGATGPAHVSHYVMNHVIEPSREGATGKAYVIEIRFDENGRGQTTPNTAVRGQTAPVQSGRGRDEWALVGRRGGEVGSLGGHYEDVYVKTAGGWRLKRREFVQSKGGPQADQPKRVGRAVADAGDATRRGPSSAPKDAPVTAGTGASLTPKDYIEIAQLVASYGNALDSGWGTGENGDAYAALYTPDASFVGAVGHDQLAALAVAQPHGPQFIRHFLTNHVIEPTPEGARGKQYLVVIDIGENGKPGSIFLGGHYEDTYAKTPEGWRFKTRRLFPARSGGDFVPPVGGR